MSSPKDVVVFDTSAILFNPEIILNKTKYEKIIIPFEVVQELDRIKTKLESVGVNARKAIKLLFNDINNNIVLLEPIGLDMNDDCIIQAAKMHNAVLITNDFNMILKSKSLSVQAELLDQELNSEVISSSDLYTGITELEVDDARIDELYDEPSNYIDYVQLDSKIELNEFVQLTSNVNPKKKIFLMKKGPERYKIIDLNKPFNVWGLEPRNVEQRLALELLLDPDIHLVSLIGLAGSGKTLLSVAAGLQQIFSRKFEGENTKRFKKMIVSRPIQVMGKDIGYLPGTVSEKLEPWVAPIMDSLQFLEDDNAMRIAGWFESGKIQVEAPTFIRGRSLPDSYFVLDEVQNFSHHEIKTVLTRAGQGTKIILTGDIEQIDNYRLTKYTNGLTYAVEKLKRFGITGHITLRKSERSKLAEICAKEL